jgi:hypothetical protein
VAPVHAKPMAVIWFAASIEEASQLHVRCPMAPSIKPIAVLFLRAAQRTHSSVTDTLIPACT